MSRSELHNWECAIESLCGDNTDKVLAIAQDIYNTAYVRGKNYVSLEKELTLNEIRAEITDWQTDIHDNEYDAEIHDFVFDGVVEWSIQQSGNLLTPHKSHLKDTSAETSVTQYLYYNGRFACLKFG